MVRLNVVTGALLAVALSIGAGAAEKPKAFTPYPGATLYTPPESEATKKWTSTLPPGTTITAYLTEDPFDKVVAFYRGIAREYVSAKKPASTVLPHGAHLHKTFLIFDGAPNLLASKEWISVQRPFVATPADVRDVTEIVLTEKVPVPKGKEEGIKKAPAKPGS